MVLNGYEKPVRPKCQAKIVCGGGKKAKRRGEKAAKWHCARCGIADWFSGDLNKECREAQNFIRESHNARPKTSL